MEGQSQSDVRPTGRWAARLTIGGLTLLDDVVRTVAPDLEHREADATLHVADLSNAIGAPTASS